MQTQQNTRTLHMIVVYVFTFTIISSTIGICAKWNSIFHYGMGSMRNKRRTGDNRMGSGHSPAVRNVCESLAPKPLLTGLALLLMHGCIDIHPDVDDEPMSETAGSTTTSSPQPTTTTTTTTGNVSDITATDSTADLTTSSNSPPSVVAIQLVKDETPVDPVLTQPADLDIYVYVADDDGYVASVDLGIGGEHVTLDVDDNTFVKLPWSVLSESQNTGIDPLVIEATATDDALATSAPVELHVDIEIHAGTQIWEKINPDNDPTEIRALAFTATGEAVVAGRRHTIGGSGKTQLYLDILDPSDGTSTLEHINFDQPDDTEAFGVAVDPSNGDILVTGRTVVNNAYYPLYVRFDREGSSLFVNAVTIYDFPGSAMAIAQHTDGHVYLTGFDGTLDQKSFVFVGKLVDDEPAWTHTLYFGSDPDGPSKRGAGFDIVSAHDGLLYLAGVHTVAPLHHEAMLVAQLDTTGDILSSWMSPFGGNIQRAEARAIAVTPDGRVVAGGLLRANNLPAVNNLQEFVLDDEHKLKHLGGTQAPVYDVEGVDDRVIYGLTVSERLVPGGFQVAAAAAVQWTANSDQVEPTPVTWVSDSEGGQPFWTWSWVRPHAHAFDIGWGPDGYHYTAGYFGDNPPRAWVRKTIP